MSDPFRKFNSIEQFHNLVHHCKDKPEFFPEWVSYRPKVKLHGTNAGIAIRGGKIYAQQRSRVAKKGHYGFVDFMKEREFIFKDMPDCHIYGEWIGAGIQKGTACNKLDKKKFCIFTIFMDEYYYADPVAIRDIIGNSHTLEDWGVHIIDWYDDDKQANVVHFHDMESCKAFIEEQEKKVQLVDKEDPWIKQEFGHEGIGEGLVYYPITDSDYENGKRGTVQTERYSFVCGNNHTMVGIHPCVFSKLVFKAKGESHKLSEKIKKPAIQLTPDEIKTQEEFVVKFVTEDRLQQMVDGHCGGNFNTKNIRKFLKNFCQDVNRESEAEREVNGIDWKMVIKPVQTKARLWFLEKSKEL